MVSAAAVADLWARVGGAPHALDQLDIAPDAVAPPSSYPIADLSTAAASVAALAACEVWHARTGDRQRVAVDPARAIAMFRSERLLRVDGKPAGELWNAFSGFYESGDGRFIQLHTNFSHHLTRMLEVLGVAADRDAVRAAIAERRGEELEDVLIMRGACAALARTREEWLALPQARAVRELPLLDAIPLGSAPARALPAGDTPLAGVRVLDLTRVLAGPVATRTFAAFGADVLRVSSPGLPEVDSVLPDTSIGKRSTFLDLRDESDRDDLRALVREADVFVQSYRPGALDALGFGPDAVAALRPDIVYVSLSAYSHAGPWSGRRGYDTLVQSASGMALAEAAAFGSANPRHLPVSGLDHATGYIAAAAAMLALASRHRERGGIHLRCSLVQTREWLDTLGRVPVSEHAVPAPDEEVITGLPSMHSPLGVITYVPFAGDLERTPARYAHGPVVPGSDAPRWLPNDRTSPTPTE